MSALPAVPIETLEPGTAPVLVRSSAKRRDILWAAIVIALAIMAWFAVTVWMCLVA